jgi:cytochrome b6-f complex iron-sulfur subunit
MFEDLEGRIDRLVEGLLRGRRLRARVGDAAEREAIMAAAELAAAREGYPRMSPAFRRKLTDTLQSGPTPGLVSRRTALGAVAGLAAGAVGAAALSRLPTGTPARPAPGVAGGVMQPAGGRWIEVALLAQLSETAPTRVVAGDQVVYLFRQGGQVTGVSAVCTHWPCTLNWQAANSALNCPCHNLNFAPDGHSTNPNYEAPPLPSFQVKVEAGRVSIFSL